MIKFSPPLVQSDIKRHCVAYDDVQGTVGTALSGAAQYTLRQYRSTGLVLPYLANGDFFYPNHSDAPQEKIGGAGDFSPSLDY